MKSKKIFLLLVLVLLTACSNVRVRVSDTLELPSLDKAPLEGKWTITKTIFTEENKLKDFSYREYIGKDSIFSIHGVVVGDTFLKEPSFKIRRVDSDEYLKTKYKTSKEKLGINSDYLYIVDVYDQDNLYFQVLREKDDLAYLDLNGVFVQMKKTSDQVVEKDIEKFSHLKGKTRANRQKPGKNGLLLAVQYGDEEDRNPFRYKTYFFRINGQNLEGVEEINQLLIPREDGFYTVHNKRIQGKAEARDVIQFEKLADSKEEGEDSEVKTPPSIGNRQVLRSILYISPKYISLENFTPSTGERSLGFYAIGSMETPSRLGFSNLVEGGESIYRSQAKYFLPPESSYNVDEKNFALYRDQGIWKYKGRIRFTVAEDYLYKDFPLSTLVGSDLSKYNRLPSPFEQLKASVNENFDDALFSPNQEILFGLEENRISVYNIDNGEVNKNPTREIYLPKNAKIVMTEWALGQFVDQWQVQMEKGV